MWIPVSRPSVRNVARWVAEFFAAGRQRETVHNPITHPCSCTVLYLAALGASYRRHATKAVRPLGCLASVQATVAQAAILGTGPGDGRCRVWKIWPNSQRDHVEDEVCTNNGCEAAPGTRSQASVINLCPFCNAIRINLTNSISQQQKRRDAMIMSCRQIFLAPLPMRRFPFRLGHPCDRTMSGITDQ